MRSTTYVIVPITLQADQDHPEDYVEEVRVRCYHPKEKHKVCLQSEAEDEEDDEHVVAAQPSGDSVAREKSEEDDLGCFTGVICIAFGAILNACVEYMSFLKCIVQGPSDVDLVFEYRTLEERFGKRQTSGDRNYNTSSLMRLQTIVGILLNILKNGRREIITSGMYLYFYLGLKKMVKEKKDEEELLSLYNKNKLKIEKLQEKLLKNKTKHLKLATKASQRVFEAKLSLDNALCISELELNYVSEWEEARRAQNQRRHQMVELSSIDSTTYHMQKIKDEERIHTELITFLEEQNQGYTESINYWTERFARDLEERDIALYEIKIKREELSEALGRLTVTYTERQQEIEEYRIVRNQRIKDEELLLKQIYASLVIQSWWRGVMVRKKLGPYRKKKGKGKGKNDKKGKRGKKKA